MKLNKEEYRTAVSLLKKYNYNLITIINIRADIMSIGVPDNNGMPKAPYTISDSVYNQYIRLQEDVELQKALKQYKIVKIAVEGVSRDARLIFEEFYVKGNTKWDILQKGMSERTFERRKNELIHAVYKEIKKWRKIGGIFLKKGAIIVSWKEVKKYKLLQGACLRTGL